MTRRKFHQTVLSLWRVRSTDLIPGDRQDVCRVIRGEGNSSLKQSNKHLCQWRLKSCGGVNEIKALMNGDKRVQLTAGGRGKRGTRSTRD